MRTLAILSISAAALSLVALSPSAMAAPPQNHPVFGNTHPLFGGSHPGFQNGKFKGKGKGKGNGGVFDAPLPLAAGLPALLLLGGALALAGFARSKPKP